MYDRTNKAVSILIAELRSRKAKTETNSLAFVTPFNPNNINLFLTVRSVSNSLQEARTNKRRV